ncbi:hypothetical protein ABPG72_005281 [Tetrahymena utriculariae]
MNPTDKKVKARTKSTQQQAQQSSKTEKTNLEESNEKDKQQLGISRLISSSSTSTTQPPRQMSSQLLQQQSQSLNFLNSQVLQLQSQTSQNQQQTAKTDQKKQNAGKYKPLYSTDSDDDFIPIKKKKIEEVSKPVQQMQTKNEEIKQQNVIIIPVAPLNINKCFQDILLQTSKDQYLLTMIKTILSAGSKKLADKQSVFKKTWTQLRNSNCSHEEYLKWEEQLKRNEAFEIKDIKETTIQRLINSKIRGFVSYDQLLEKGKREYIIRNKLEEDSSILSKEFKLEDKSYEEFRNDQFTLLEKLMKENNLVAIDMLKPDMMKQARELSSQVSINPQMMDEALLDQDLLLPGHIDKSDVEKQLEFLEEEENVVQKVSLCKYFENKQKMEQSASTQNQSTDNGSKFSSSFTSPNQNSSNNNDPYEIEKNIEKYCFQKIFKSYDDFIHLQPSDNCLIAKRVKSLLLDIKSDELFTDAKFQKEQFEKYQKMLKQINDIDQFDINKLSEETLKNLVEIAAYIMNNVHYFQKFNLKCDLLHPLDLLYVTEKFLKQSNQQNSYSGSSSSSNSSTNSNQAATQENKPKSILEDSLKVIQERTKKQHSGIEKQQENDSLFILETSVEQKKQISSDNNHQKNDHLDTYQQQLRVNAIQSANQNTNQSTNLSSQKSQNYYQIEQRGDIQSKSLLDSQNEFTNKDQKNESQQKIILTSPLSYQKKNESSRYIQEIQLDNDGNNINQDKNKSFDFNMVKNRPSLEAKQYKQSIGVQNLDQKDFEETKLISPITNDSKSNSNQYQMQNDLDVVSNHNSNQYRLTPMQENNYGNNTIEQIKQSSSMFLTPVKTDQKKSKSQQKHSQKEKLAKEGNKIKQNQNLSAVINQSSPTQEENKQNQSSLKKIHHQHFRMDGNYYQSNSPEDMSKHSKNQFVIREQDSRLSGQIIERKKNGEEEDLQNQKRSIDYNRSNQRSNSGKKQIFTKSYYDDESHKKFIMQKIKERKQLQIKREKQFLEQQEHRKKQEIEELEEQNKKRQLAIQQRSIFIQERMKKSKQYRESLEANKSSSREKSPIFEHRQKPLYLELQEKFQQNQQKEIEERKKILETEKAKKQNYKLEDIIKHQKELTQLLNDGQNSQKKSQQLDWHYEKPKYQSKLWEICEYEKNESYKKEYKKQIMRKLKEERRHKFGQQIREDSQNKNQMKQNSNNDGYSENRENDTIDGHFLSQSKYYEGNTPHKIEVEGNLLEIKDGKINKSEQKNKKHYNYLQTKEHQKSVNSFNENSINTIDFDQEPQNQKYTNNQVLNKISNSQHNLYHLSNRFRGNKIIQRQYTADQLQISYDLGKGKKENQNQNKYNQNINFIKQVQQKDECQFEKNNFLNQNAVQNLPNLQNNQKNNHLDCYPDTKQKNPHKKIYSAKERLNIVASSNQSFNNQRNNSKNRSEKTNDSKSTSEIYQDLIKLHDQSLKQKLNNKSKSVHERVEDVKIETKKMEQIANRQQKLLKVSSNDEIDRVFISEIYIKSIKAKLAVLDEIVPFYNSNNKNCSNRSKSQQQDTQSLENNNQSINQKSQIINQEQQDTSMQTQFSQNQNHGSNIKKTLRFAKNQQIEQQNKQ